MLCIDQRYKLSKWGKNCSSPTRPCMHVVLRACIFTCCIYVQARWTGR